MIRSLVITDAVHNAFTWFVQLSFRILSVELEPRVEWHVRLIDAVFTDLILMGRNLVERFLMYLMFCPDGEERLGPLVFCTRSGKRVTSLSMA